MNDVCNFIPTKSSHDNIECYHFVYETGIKKFPMPIVRTSYYINIVFKGTGVITLEGKDYPLTPGTLFFNFPGIPFSIDCDNDFSFLYISFGGGGAASLLENYNISEDNFIFSNLENLSSFWMKEVRRINHTNSVLLTESVLMYSLSYTIDKDKTDNQEITRFESVLEYINSNFKNPDLSLMKISDMFFYNKKYLSSLFIKETGVKFTDYLNNLRITESKKLIKAGEKSVSILSSKCGFSDQYYFSKVFKKYMGVSPSTFMKTYKSS